MNTGSVYTDLVCLLPEKEVCANKLGNGSTVSEKFSFFDIYDAGNKPVSLDGVLGISPQSKNAPSFFTSLYD